MNTSTNSIVSTNQKIRVRWQKVKEAYEAARMERSYLIPRRTPDMLKCHWGRVAPTCLKWSGSYDEALKRKKSGTRDEDVLKVVHLIHQRKHEKDSETPSSESQGGSSTRPEGVKKAKARMTGKMVIDQSIQTLSAFGENPRLNSEIMKEKTEVQKQKEA
ncbi:glutathione S-transferase T3-like [Amaranthus tricolor]|uniref:glutathione S-transferase T3-like n=1 Tax=Amaranthus tricolor TaxID=29722 RepID=UPI002588F529|nr:glutathione S-transferase T3-like [Amaranthus tricolor]